MPEEIPSTEEIVSLLKQQRDEIKLKIHLGGKDAQDQWDEMEGQWEDFQQSLKPLSEAVKEAVGSAGEQASKVGVAAAEVTPQKLKDGYAKLREMLD